MSHRFLEGDSDASGEKKRTLSQDSFHCCSGCAAFPSSVGLTGDSEVGFSGGSEERKSCSNLRPTFWNRSGSRAQRCAPPAGDAVAHLVCPLPALRSPPSGTAPALGGQSRFWRIQLPGALLERLCSGASSLFAASPSQTLTLAQARSPPRVGATDAEGAGRFREQSSIRQGSQSGEGRGWGHV